STRTTDVRARRRQVHHRNTATRSAVVMRLHGHGASRGSALGRARVRLPYTQETGKKHVPAATVEGELQRLHQAIDAARAEMRELRHRLQGALPAEVGE